MKHLLIISAVILSFSFTPQSSCGDGNLYSVKKQTKNDRRFNQYEKIKKGPKFTGGDLDEFIEKNLELSEVAKTQIFVLNYQFTVTCEGK